MIFYTLFNGLFSVVMFFMVVACLYVLIKIFQEWNRNNHSPRLIVDALVVSKRMEMSHHHTGTGVGGLSHGTIGSTTYYVTFQLESEDRLELKVPGMEYGMMVEGDYGKLTFQGTRYLDFVRK
jgi:hypothetical protein